MIKVHYGTFSGFFKGTELCAQENTSNGIPDREILINYGAIGSKVESDLFECSKVWQDHFPPPPEVMEELARSG